MQIININIKQIIGFVVLLLGVAGSALAFNPAARTGNDNRTPDLPVECASLQVETGNKVSSRAYALGVQIYRWNGAEWEFVAPAANLYADADYHGQIGIHYGGPTWESNSGSQVVAARVPGTGCTPDAAAIPWLLLQTVSTDGPGIFKKVTFIQRVNTAGGLRPTIPGTTIGEEARVPYTAEYYFYRSAK
jgi:hypothetical protein